MAASPPWKDLPAAALHEILRHIPCEADRLRVRVVCLSWRVALAQLADPPLPPQLPWLLRPSAGGPSFSCLLTGGGSASIHRARVPNDVRHARYFGSYDGRWLFLAYGQNFGHMLLNLRTNNRFRLPDEVPLPSGEGLPMIILAAALSSPPNDDDDDEEEDEQCVAAAIVHCSYFIRNPRHITFWRMGRLQAMASIPPPRSCLEMEDVIYHNGAFHFLSRATHVLVCTPDLDHGVLQVNQEWRFVQHDGLGYDRDVGARYLVESRGQLLMVVKCTANPGWPSPASAFRVFQLTQLQMPNNDEVQYDWIELPTLDGRMLFVGRGCSRSYEVSDFPGFEDAVYFLDDGSFYDMNTVLQNLPYPCFNNGKWSGPPPHPHVDRCFPPEQGQSNYSSPVWLLH